MKVGEDILPSAEAVAAAQVIQAEGLVFTTSSLSKPVGFPLFCSTEFSPERDFLDGRSGEYVRLTGGGGSSSQISTLLDVQGYVVPDVAVEDFDAAVTQMLSGFSGDGTCSFDASFGAPDSCSIEPIDFIDLVTGASHGVGVVDPATCAAGDTLDTTKMYAFGKVEDRAGLGDDTATMLSVFSRAGDTSSGFAVGANFLFVYYPNLRAVAGVQVWGASSVSERTQDELSNALTQVALAMLIPAEGRLGAIVRG